MMKTNKKAIKAGILCLLVCSLTPVYAVMPRLHVDGNKIKDPNGNIVVLRGIDMMDLGFLQDW